MAGDPRQLDRERQSLEAEVSRRSVAFRAEQRPVVLDEVRAAIPEDAALVEIALYRPYRPSEKRAERSGAPRYVAYVLRRRGDPAFAELGAAAEVDAAVLELRRALSDPVRDARRLGRGLDDQVMAKVRPLLGGARKIYLSPDGALNLVPFGALVDEDQRYLVERYSFTYLTSGRDLLRFAQPATPRGRALVVGDPAFDEAGAGPAAPAEPCEGCRTERAIDMANITFPRLPATAAEARAIGQRLSGARVLTGAAATETALKAEAGPAVLHIATHGFFLPARLFEPDGPAPSGLDESDRARAAAMRQENPMLRAGLAFAGANRLRSGQDDGVLTAAEASGLDLHGTKLVVLSACETGLGEASTGEGVEGLRRALTMAGAETQVISLWRLDDTATRDLMIAYYDRLVTGAGRSEALREAQLSMLGRPATAHPFFWAGLIASGDGAPLSPTLRSGPAKVTPGARGCACAQGTDRGGGELGGALALGAAMVAWRRFTAALRRPRHHRGSLEPASKREGQAPGRAAPPRSP